MVVLLNFSPNHYKISTNAATSVGRDLIQTLADKGITLVQLQRRNQAADLKLTADAYEFARAQRHNGCVVCVSNDTGVVETL